MNKPIYILLLIFFPSFLIAQSIENLGETDKTYYENGNLFTERISNPEESNPGTGVQSREETVYFEDGKIMGVIKFDSENKYIYAVAYYSNGLISNEKHYNDGKIISEKCWDEFGSIMQCNKENGPFLSYWDNEEKQLEGYYINGEKDGVWKTYYECGNIMQIQSFKNGVPGTEKIYYESGQYKVISNNNGEYKKWNITGELEREGQMINGLVTGIWKYYNKDGTVDYEITYNQGVPIYKTLYIGEIKASGGVNAEGGHDGIWKVFNSSGNLIRQLTYKNGDIVDTE